MEKIKILLYCYLPQLHDPPQLHERFGYAQTIFKVIFVTKLFLENR